MEWFVYIFLLHKKDDEEKHYLASLADVLNLLSSLLNLNSENTLSAEVIRKKYADCYLRNGIHSYNAEKITCSRIRNQNYLT